MATTFIDIFNNIIKYNNQSIIIVIDDNIPWFSAIDVAKLLEYVRTDDAIRTKVDKLDKKQFKDLEKFMNNIPKNMQPHAIFINESGVYSLILSSKMPKAKEFRHWITSEVLPSIRKTGSYQIEEEYIEELDDLNDKIKELKKENKILKNNQKKGKYEATIPNEKTTFSHLNVFF